MQHPRYSIDNAAIGVDLSICHGPTFIKFHCIITTQMAKMFKNRFLAAGSHNDQSIKSIFHLLYKGRNPAKFEHSSSIRLGVLLTNFWWEKEEN